MAETFCCAWKWHGEQKLLKIKALAHIRRDSLHGVEFRMAKMPAFVDDSWLIRSMPDWTGAKSVSLAQGLGVAPMDAVRSESSEK